MAGWRIGMVAGDGEMIAQILKVKSQMDSGMFKPLQMAAVKALEQGPEWFKLLNEEYKRRRVLAGEIFDLLGAEYDPKSSGMFLWGRIGQTVNSGAPCLSDDQTPHDPAAAGCSLQKPAGLSADCSRGQQVSDKLLYEAGVFITPGFIFGKNGEDYIRISLCAKPQVLKKAYDRIIAATRNIVSDRELSKVDSPV